MPASLSVATSSSARGERTTYRCQAGGAPAVRPAVEVRELHAQDAGLQLVQARVVADQLERLLVARAVEAQRAQRLVQLGGVGGDGAAVAERADVLRRVEGERRDRPERPRAAAVRQARAGGLGGVL